MSDGRRRGRGGRKEGPADAGGMPANKTRTPHRDVGKNNAGPSVFGARAAMDDVLLCLPCATPSPPKKMVKGGFWGGFVGVLLLVNFFDVQCVFLAVDVLCVGGSGVFGVLTFLGRMVLR